MKRIKTIETLAERAIRTGYARTMRRGWEVYSLSYEDDILTMKHYGTTTIEYDVKGCELLYHYGESVSDRDSMNTLLSYLGEHRYLFRFGPVMGFIMEVND